MGRASSLTIGWLGLGKLGYPCAAVLATAGHVVYGYDPAPQNFEELSVYEPGLDRLKRPILVDSVTSLVGKSPDVVFVAVQTPHDPSYGGESPPPYDSKDFEYGFLTQAIRSVVAAAKLQEKSFALVVVSTVLPGTLDRYVRPLLRGTSIKLIYHPSLVAMGRVVDDYSAPEMVICGVDDPKSEDILRRVYAPIHNAPYHPTSIASAELLKVTYNTFISMKTVFANLILEICEKTGADANEIHAGLLRATKRIVSGAYLKGGMGDGGGCHPRDNIALSHLSEQIDLSHNFFRYIIEAREAYSRWLAGKILDWARLTSYPVILLGKAYKPGVTLTAGSPALLLAHHLDELDVVYQHLADFMQAPGGPCVFFVALEEPIYVDLASWVGQGSVVIDPFGIVKDAPNVTVVRLGRKS